MTGTKAFDVTTQFGTEKDCSLTLGRYADNNHIAISIWCADGPFSGLTVNLSETGRYPENYAFVDTNNCPWAPGLIKKLRIGKPTGHTACSGFCIYPLYQFDLSKVHDYSA